MQPRSLCPIVIEDLSEKMVFVAGPRQVGKTTLAKTVLATAGPGAYYSWDNRRDRRIVLDSAWPPAPALIVLDEFHKYRHWKRWIKGEHDQHAGSYRFLLTGSARLDVYRKGGDSLQGRYHHLRLHPLSAGELLGIPPRARPFEPLPIESAPSGDGPVRLLLERGGFPEPLFAGSTRILRRWQRERLDRFFREDVRELDTVRDLSSMELLADLLPERVGSPLSLNALREILEVSHRAVTHWVDVLERLYFLYRLPTFLGRRVRALKKEQKAYLWDWTLVEAEGPRFENFVASHLLKLCHHLEDVEGHRAQLHYLRDRDGREVDFLVTVNRKPWFAVEAKVGSDKPSSHLRYFGQRFEIPFLYQVVSGACRDHVRDGIRITPAARLLPAIA